jgi:hypothetical protein
VAEADAPVARAQDEHAFLERGSQPGVDGRPVDRGGGGQQLDLDLAAEPGHHLEYFHGVGRQVVEAGGGPVEDVRPAGRLTHIIKVPPPALAAGYQHAGPAQRVEQLDCVVRVAAGPLGDRHRERLGRRLVEAQPVGDERGTGGRRQVAQFDVQRRGTEPARAGQLLDLDGRPSVPTDDEHPGDGLVVHEGVDEFEPVGGRPLQVVEDHDDRAPGRGDGARQVEGGRAEPGRYDRRVEVGGLGRDPHELAELRQHGGGQPHVAADDRGDALPDAGELLLRLDQHEPKEAAEGEAQAVGVLVVAVLVELPGHEPAVVGGDQWAQGLQ